MIADPLGIILDVDRLKELVAIAFDKVARPDRGEIAPHKCCECDEIASEFSRYEATDVPLEILAKHCWDLPLFSAEAKRYFLPAWIFSSIDDPASGFTDALLMNLEADHRNDGYTLPQRQAIQRYLEYVSPHVGEFSRTHLNNATARWK